MILGSWIVAGFGGVPVAGSLASQISKRRKSGLATPDYVAGEGRWLIGGGWKVAGSDGLPTAGEATKG